MAVAVESLPVHPLTLNFYAPEREAAYRRALFQRSLKGIRWALLGCILIHLLYLYVDVLVLKDSARCMWAIRLAILIPLLGAMFVCSFFEWFGDFDQRFFAVVLYLNTAAMCVGHALSGSTSTMYFVSGTVLCLMVGYVLVGLRFAYAAPVFWLAFASHAVTVWLLQLPADLTIVAMEVLTFSILTLTFGAYRMETLSRQEQYVAEQLLAQERREAEQLLAQERREREWLSIFADFTRHELKNSVAGINLSLQLISAATLDHSIADYTGRARRCVESMRRILEQVAGATNLESALKQQEQEVLSLSDVVAGCVENLRGLAADRRLEANVASDLHVRGNADALAQMVDKLLNNALEHSGATALIEVSLAVEDRRARLAVSNHGDPLPADPERLFKLFVSSKRSSGNGNLGLGLYVARTIAAHHGGSIHAEPLVDPRGARFIVLLPLVPGA